MEELGNLLQDLPLYVQAGIVMVVMAVGAIFGVKIPTQSRKSKPGTSGKTSTLRSTLTASQGTKRSTEDSPGHSGADATTDLPASALATLKLTYAPSLDGTPDPGEVVWTWVPFVENDGRGKDRPVLIIGRIDPESVAGCYLSTKQHRNFIRVGKGPWDPQGRPSYLNPERILRVTDRGMRREGAVVQREQFQDVAAELIDFYKRRTTS